MIFNFKHQVQKILQGAGIEINGVNPWDIQVHDSRFYKRALIHRSLGLGESYMDGWWDCEALDEMFFRLVHTLNVDGNLDTIFNLHRIIVNYITNQQSKSASLKVAKIHYNLNNQLYSAMLGDSMAYTCGYWKDTHDLSNAQYAKYNLVCKKLRLQPGERILELGCGWGGFAKYAATHYGVVLDCVNISSEQIKFAKELCIDLPVTLHQCDYRDPHVYNPNAIKYDKVVSIGLCEHIGYKNYGQFMQIVRDNLKEDGLFLLHTIGKNVSTRYMNPWIEKYIFPGSILPSMKRLSKAAEHRFVIEDVHNFGPDYDKTLMAWHANFEKAWPEFKSQYDERFYRMWRYYLLCCAGGFRGRNIQLWQWVLSPKGQIGGYTSIR